MRIALACILLTTGRAFAVTPSAPLNGEPGTSPPNIVYILADDLGYGDLGCYGQAKFRTPHIDRLAAEGMRFTQHYAGSTVCAPSRCALMTGLHTGHAQVRGNRELKPEGQVPLKPGTVAIPTLLKNAGYVTGMFGKWGLGGPGSDSDPMVFFDAFYGYNCQRQAHNFYPGHLWHNREKVQLNGKKYSHDLIMDAALAFVRKHHDRPFFCYLPVTIPHAAMQAPPDLHRKYREQYPQFDDQVGKYGGTDVENPIAAFPAMVERLDNGVGDLMNLLKELEIDDRTIVMFSSDNGPHQEGGHDPEFWNSNGPLKGIKRSLHDGGIRVPFIVRWPGRVAPGATSGHVSAFWDMLPTFCEIAGVAAPEGLDGLSLLPALLQKDQPTHDYLYWEFPPRGGAQAVRVGRFKAIRRNLNREAEPPVELYDFTRDIEENMNIASQFPDVCTSMLKIFDEAHVPSSAFPLLEGE